MTTSNCPACTNLQRVMPGLQCNHCRKIAPNATSKVSMAAARDYVANGPLGTEKVAQYDAAFRAAE